MDRQKISETEALDIIARVFDRNMRRMNYVRGELFICWGALLSLTALAEDYEGNLQVIHWNRRVEAPLNLIGLHKEFAETSTYPNS